MEAKIIKQLKSVIDLLNYIHNHNISRKHYKCQQQNLIFNIK